MRESFRIIVQVGREKWHFFNWKKNFGDLKKKVFSRFFLSVFKLQNKFFGFFKKKIFFETNFLGTIFGNFLDTGEINKHPTENVRVIDLYYHTRTHWPPRFRTKNLTTPKKKKFSSHPLNLTQKENILPN